MTAVRQRTGPTKIALRRARAFLTECGLPVKGAVVRSNGDIVLLTDSPVAPLPLSREQELDAEIEGLIEHGDG